MELRIDMPTSSEILPLIPRIIPAHFGVSISHAFLPSFRECHSSSSVESLNQSKIKAYRDSPKIASKSILPHASSVPVVEFNMFLPTIHSIDEEICPHHTPPPQPPCLPHHQHNHHDCQRLCQILRLPRLWYGLKFKSNFDFISHPATLYVSLLLAALLPLLHPLCLIAISRTVTRYRM